MVDKNWVFKGPEIRELIIEIRDKRDRMKSDTAIIIPTYKRPHILKEHLKELTKQTTKDFDVVIIYGNEDEILNDEIGLSAAHIKRKEDIGSAGGFYLGEKFCLQEGYRNIILADDDCNPESENLVSRIVAGLDGGAGVVFPMIAFGSGFKAGRSRILAQYAGIRVDVLKKVGLTYLPLYVGGEDIELYYRIADRGAEIVDITSVARHPSLDFILTYAPNRAFTYHRGVLLWRILRNKHLRFLVASFTFLLAGLSLCFINGKLGRAISMAVIKASSLDFSSSQFPAERGVPNTPLDEGKEIVIRPKTHDEFEEDFVRHGWGAELLKRARDAIANILKAPSCFGKDVVFEERLGVGEIPFMLVARRTFWRNSDTCWQLTENRLFWLSPFYFFLIILAILPVFLATICLVAYGSLKKAWLGINTEGYGL